MDHTTNWNRIYEQRRKASRYYRPKYGPGRRAGLVGNIFSEGDMEKPFSSEWEDIFAPEDNWNRRTSVADYAKALAAKFMLGAEIPDKMEDDGSMSYKLNRPIGGHGVAYVDILYLDQDMRILRGNAGSLFVQVRDRTTTTTSSSSCGMMMDTCLLLPKQEQVLLDYQMNNYQYQHQTQPTHPQMMNNGDAPISPLSSSSSLLSSSPPPTRQNDAAMTSPTSVVAPDDAASRLLSSSLPNKKGLLDGNPSPPPPITRIRSIRGNLSNLGSLVEAC